MYAIIKTGGKQYRVSKGDVIDVELLDGDLGSQVQFTDVLFYSDGTAYEVGGPVLSEFVVTGELVDYAAGPKVTSVKYKPSHHQYRKFGHRQHYSRVKITDIGGKSASKKKHHEDSEKKHHEASEKKHSEKKHKEAK